MNPVESVLLENIDNPNSCFIFPTDIAASGWADHLLRIRGGTIAMKKFIAWDIFKQNSIKSRVQNKKSIPSALRKIFVSRLVKENAEAVEQGKPPVFSSLVRAQWAAQASRFVPWLTGILPQLGAWFTKVTGRQIGTILDAKTQSVSMFEGDGTDTSIYKDMFNLAKRYAHFLEEHGLFEPAWETPPFNDEGMECFIFFPESLSDYSEYRELLAASSHVKIINVPDTEKMPCDTFFYTNSRREITEAALYIRALHENLGISWDAIAVCIPDTENYEPYVIREFKNRNIPFVKRTSKPLTDYPAGTFFRSVLDCTSRDFSFSSFVALIVNRNLPWKDTAVINKLVKFGIDNNCLYSWAEEKDGERQHINVWEDAFVKPFGGIDSETGKFFHNLKRRLQTLRSAPSFSELRRQYFIFREQFLDMDNCPEESDLILSRCISELMDLVELEKNFPDVPAVDPFSFFTEYLGEVYYLARPKTSGTAILPYKTAAAAPFDYHIIIGAGQDSLSVVYTHLDFLPQKKREELGILDEDASSTFINLHKINSIKAPAFFCSEQTFSGFSIPHSKIGAPSEPKECFARDPKLEKKFSQDYYNTERNFYFSFTTDSSEIVKLHENQITGFTEWKNHRKDSYSPQLAEEGSFKTGEILQDYIRSIYAKNGKYNVSASSLQPYFQCSLKWLFERVLSIKNVTMETSLMAENISGLVYHAVLNYFFTELKNKNETLMPPDMASENAEQGLSLPPSYRQLLTKSIDFIFNSFPALETGMEPKMSSLTLRLLSAGKNDFQYHLENCLANFLSFFAGCRVAESEISYETEKDSLILKGTVDCVLEDISNNKYIIVDFKLKRLPKRDTCTGEGENGLSNFQLPMYITLIEENEKLQVYTALFYSILDYKSEVLFGTIHEVNTKKEFPKKEDDRIIKNSEWYNQIFSEFNEKAKQFSREISTGNFTVFESKYNNCFECEYNRICRTVYIINRERNTTSRKN